MSSRTNIIKNIDWPVVMLYLLMIIFGWINIYAAVYNEDHHSIFDITQSYGKQMLWIVTSLVLAVVIMAMDAKFYSVFSFAIYGLMLVLQVLVLVLGKEVAGSKSWFGFGSFGLQPAEFMKFATALALSGYLSKFAPDLKKNSELFKTLLIIVIPVIFIELQNDTGTALVFLSFLLVLYRQGMSGTWLFSGVSVLVLFFLTLIINKFILIGILALITILVLLMIRRNLRNVMMIVFLFLVSVTFVFGVDYSFHHILKPHQQTRVNVLLGKETDMLGAGYNVHQSLIAIGSGGFAGKGFLQGTQTKFNFVPEQSTDFIFCTVGEEWGFLGSLAVVLMFALLLIRLIKLAERQRSPFSRIYGYGVFAVIFFHFAVNIAMTLGLFPVIGIPLPFFSYGGSSLWAFTILLFIFVRLDAERLNIL
ncbi:MAG TPA: rod shape-determining protein RodA [Bacteroidales bacterium]|nr:rod shape-determining protein RodA [Bacteroidales bacterium]